jgi:hypothetical protein
MKKRGFKIALATLVISTLIVPSAFASCLMTGISTMTGVDNGSVTSGVITNLDDNNTATDVTVTSSGAMKFWFIKDMQSDVDVTSVVLKQWEQHTGADANFQVRYSSTALSGANTGTQCDTNVTASNSAQDSTFTCSVTARYWGFYRLGTFTGETITAEDFNITGNTGCSIPPPVVTFGSSTVATSTLQLVGTTAVGFAILITIALIYLIAYIYNSMFKKKPWHNS